MTSRLIRKRYFGLLLIIALLCAIAALASKKGFEHNLAGLPHWATTCPQDAAAILVIGQSQASNTGPQRHISFSSSRAFAGGECFYLRDPMPGTSGRGGTIWPLLADNLSRRVLIADIAISGSAIEQWTTAEQLLKVRRTLADLKAAGYPQPLVIWMQGETNGARQTSADDYLRQLRILLTTAPDKHWLITKESICYGRQAKWKPLDIAREQIARESHNVTLGPDLDSISLPFRQADQCHMTAEGQMRLAGLIARAVEPLLRSSSTSARSEHN